MVSAWSPAATRMRRAVKLLFRATVQVLGDVQDIIARNCVASVVFEDFDEAPERVECFMGRGVLGGREYVA